MLIAGSAQRYARTPPRPVRCALRGSLAQPLRRGGRNQQVGLSTPGMGVREGKFTSHYSRTYVEAAQRRPESEVPRVSDRQWQALDLLAEIAEEQCLEMSFAPGDIQFVNNHVIYHARSAFEDDDEGHGRLLLRLWLSMPNSRALPGDHEVLWRAVEAGALRGGIGQSGVPV